MFFWGANWTSTKILTEFASAATINTLRFTIVSFLFLGLLLWQKTSFRISKKDTALIFLSTLIMATYHTLFIKGVSTGLAGSGGVLVTTTNPIITFVLVALLYQKRFQKKEILGLILGLISAILFLKLWQFDLSELAVSGTFHFLTASLLWACTTVLREKIDAPAILYIFYLFLPIPFMFAFGVSPTEIQSLSSLGPLFWGNLLYLSTFGTVFSTTAFFYYAKVKGPKAASSFIFIVPTFAMLIAMIFLREPLVWTTIAGGITALLSVYIINKPSKKLTP